jgi:predicted ATP-dependent endonuclease of OLD family
MKINKIEVKNFRLLKNFSLDLEDELSLVIGKNNSGKTSLLLILNRFLKSNSSGKFEPDDFSLEYKDKIFEYLSTGIPDEDSYIADGIHLRLYIYYTDTDNLANISQLMMDLDEANNQIILQFEYQLPYTKLQQMKTDYDKFDFSGEAKDKFDYFFKNNFNEYFKKHEKSVALDQDNKITDYIDLQKEKISLKDVITYRFISAKREVSNKDRDKTLSSQTSKIYEKIESTPDLEEAVNKFKLELLKTDKELDKSYEPIFTGLINKVKKFGGVKDGESNIKIHSSLQHQELLKGNTTIMYSHDESSLPEHYNGLGYMNLISMIFEIETLLMDFKKSRNEKPADINLLFIEEPEAHTHPQMQYIFIKNIKTLLKDGIQREDGNNRELQYIISTHSSHIVSECEFNDIKYLKKASNNNIEAKNIKDLENEYIKDDKEQNYRFLKQYLTLHRSELFFADKSILIEGDTERILLPAMMKKIDNESSIEEAKLLSQNISIIEVGAYSQIFEKFIDFIGVKSLVITDIDSIDEDSKAVEVANNSAIKTSNSALKYFFDTDDLKTFTSKTVSDKILYKNPATKKWEVDKNGLLHFVYQIEEENSDDVKYSARSFEDSFFHVNKQFIADNLDDFQKGLKNLRYMNKDHESYIDDVYEWAEKCVDKKPSFAIEILINSKSKDGQEFTNWNIPSYIKEGLIWLRDS